MANGYDTHSLAATGLDEASSSDGMPMMAVRDKRYTRSGIGFRSQAREATALDPELIGETPPPIMYPDGYLGGTAARRRGRVDESKLPWETAQEATAPQIRPREALPPWLADKEGDEDEERESERPDMKEAPLDAKQRGDLDAKDFALPGRKYPIDTPERARSALARVKQFGSPEEQKKVKAAVARKYPDMKVD
ncbi:hypothetical protein [Streptomyces cucumeris]|uniref:hypothetical protein n=1 Tax=Streptomyces cucumeris TaxID=2962890 RepID=UPI0020C871C4|nr:hypothetical protein [Streptomyces sp. NEAU-Y11]MCP9209617.1 hypothetical protein [Streptomyces sp. NEAU-Y11]